MGLTAFERRCEACSGVRRGFSQLIALLVVAAVVSFGEIVSATVEDAQSASGARNGALTSREAQSLLQFKRMLAYAPGTFDDYAPYDIAAYNNMLASSSNFDDRLKRVDGKFSVMRFGKRSGVDYDSESSMLVKKEVPGAPGLLRFGKRDTSRAALLFGKRGEMPGVLRFGRK